MKLTLPVVLASASPRRTQLLGSAGVEFLQDPADVDETLVGDPEPELAAQELACRKARAVIRRHSAGTLVLGSDTIVALDGQPARLLGKPRDAEEARSMLRSLSGSRHRVVTGVCVAVAGPVDLECSSFERTWVHMRAILPGEVEAYVASEEWRGKAGGYAIQENADAFVTRLEEGGFDNVVGLPVELSLRLLAEAESAYRAASS